MKILVIALVLWLSVNPCYGAPEKVYPQDPRQVVYPILIDRKLIVDFPGLRNIYKETWNVYNHITRRMEYRTIVTTGSKK